MITISIFVSYTQFLFSHPKHVKDTLFILSEKLALALEDRTPLLEIPDDLSSGCLVWGIVAFTACGASNFSAKYVLLVRYLCSGLRVNEL
jgi:hypothetical protein